MKIKDNRARYFIYSVFFILFVYLGYKAPYCLDEWKWGLPQRMELMKRGFSGYNGRYLGNILALLITRSEVAKTLVISVCMVLVVWLMEVSVRRKSFSKRQVRSDPSSEYHFTVACCPGFPVWTELWMAGRFCQLRSSGTVVSGLFYMDRRALQKES